MAKVPNWVKWGAGLGALYVVWKTYTKTRDAMADAVKNARKSTTVPIAGKVVTSANAEGNTAGPWADGYKYPDASQSQDAVYLKITGEYNPPADRTMRVA